MITKELIERINALYHKRITNGLTAEEQQEEQELRKKYLAGIRAQVEQTVANVEIVDADDERLGQNQCKCGEDGRNDCCHGGHGHKH